MLASVSRHFHYMGKNVINEHFMVCTSFNILFVLQKESHIVLEQNEDESTHLKFGE